MPTGIYPRTKETRAKMSARMMGNQIAVGKRNFLGCKHSSETRAGIGAA